MQNAVTVDAIRSRNSGTLTSMTFPFSFSLLFFTCFLWNGRPPHNRSREREREQYPSRFGSSLRRERAKIEKKERRWKKTTATTAHCSTRSDDVAAAVVVAVAVVGGAGAFLLLSLMLMLLLGSLAFTLKRLPSIAYYGPSRPINAVWIEFWSRAGLSWYFFYEPGFPRLSVGG